MGDRGVARAAPDRPIEEGAARHGLIVMRPGAIFVGALSLLLLAPASGWPHASLVKSVPARRAILHRSPERVQLWFNERLEPQFSHVSVLTPTGHPVDLKDTAVGPDDPKKLSVAVPALLPGTYTVRFRVLSVDGHVVAGQFSFTIVRPE